MVRTGWVLAAFAGAAFGVWAASLQRRVSAYQIEARAEVEHATQRSADIRKMAHDLRNPLTTIKARSELLSQKLADRPSEQRQLDSILRAVNRLDQLIGELGPRLS